MIVISARNAPKLYVDGIWKFLACNPVEEGTRNGKALVLQEPVLLDMMYPTERVLTDPARDANPFFHVMEFVWMLAGEQDVKWIAQFNKNMKTYAEKSGKIQGAYGFRWRRLWDDQIAEIIGLLRADPTTRQAILTMWDPELDMLQNWKDRPCNTHIMFRVVNGKLDMTVCNRSNDFMWGMLGTNIVHMTLLHELIAALVGLKLGSYRVFSNNAHIYLNIKGYPTIPNPPVEHNVYRTAKPYPIWSTTETYKDFIHDAEQLVRSGATNEFNTRWFRSVAVPMYLGYTSKQYRDDYINAIEAEDWRVACHEWAARRKNVTTVTPIR